MLIDAPLIKAQILLRLHSSMLLPCPEYLIYYMFYIFISLDLLQEGGSINAPTIQVRKLRHKEMI